MLVKKLNRGMINPILFAWQVLMISGLALGLSACSSPANLSQFSSGGYLTDGGIVRLWRQDDPQQQSQMLLRVYSPKQGSDTTITFYEYQQGVLRQIRHRATGQDLQIVQLRFDEQGAVNFMQRQRVAKREPLSVDEIIFYKFEAKYILDLSSILRAEGVKLIQGRWHHNVLVTCAGEVQHFRFEQYAQSWLEQRAQTTESPLGVAWLEWPKGRELLMVAFEDFCLWQPTPTSLVEMNL